MTTNAKAISTSKRISSVTGKGNEENVPNKRRSQQRAVETKDTIIRAALIEFAEKGFDAASIRNIAERTGFQHPLITYHYKTKEILWKAVAEHAFGTIRKLWDAEVVADPALPAIDRLRKEYRAFLRFTLDYPDFHHFMLRESRPGNPRLPWLINTMINPELNRLVPQIRAAQAANELPQGDPVLLHYLLIGATSVLSSLGAEIREATGLSPDSTAVVETYWSLIEQTVFGDFHRQKDR